METIVILTIFVFIYLITLYVVRSFYLDIVRGLNNSIDNMERGKMLSHVSYLKALRREYALNILNSNEILELDRKLDAYEKKVIRMDKQEFNIEISAFWNKYPVIEEFNPFGIGPHFAKYGDEKFKLIIDDDFDKKEKYLEIGKYIVLLSRFLLYGGEPTVERLNTGTDIKELKETQHRYDNQRLEKLGIEAIKRTRRTRSSILPAKYEDDEFNIFPLLNLNNENPAQYHFGIHLKSTNENIIYSIFVDDFTFETLYRSNEKFEMLSDINYGSNLTLQ